MPNKPLVVAITAVAPVIWSTTYLVTTEFLPPGGPVFAAAARCLPAGILLLALTRRLPDGSWWWRAALLGTLNVGLFSALLFVAADRLPGGIAATVGAIQPLIVAALASRLVAEPFTIRKAIGGVAGISGVALLVISAAASLDLIGVMASLGATTSMAVGVVLTKRWGQPASPLTTTSWQLVAGGLVLAPLLVVVPGATPVHLTPINLAGYAYLCLVGCAIAYPIWFWGISRLPVTSASFLSLLSPLSAIIIGWIVLGQALSFGQMIGAAVIVGALALALTAPAPPIPAASVTESGQH